ncbi:MAG: putative toxin-antitoxin system toxin component, PIN family [Terracidiphilus sp.]
MRAVLDTSVLVAALRSSTGASSLLVEAVLSERMKPLISVPLVLEYEAVLTRPEHLLASGFTAQEAVKIVKAFCRKGEPVHIAFRLRPQLLDPNDEFVLETAFHGRADVIVSFNRKDFEPAKAFGIQTISPKEAWQKMRSL